MFFLNNFAKIIDFRIMSKKIAVNGIDVWVKEGDFNNLRDMFKENVTVIDLEKWQTEV